MKSAEQLIILPSHLSNIPTYSIDHISNPPPPNCRLLAHMPSLRRSQGEPSSPSSTPRASGRKRKPSKKNALARVLDDNTRVSTQVPYESTRASTQERPHTDSDEFNAERSSRGPPTSKDLLPDIRLSNTLGAAANSGFHGNTSEGRQAVRDHQARQSCEAAAAAHIHAKKAKEDAEWAVECKEHGEEEARRRRLEELEAARDMAIIPTSEIEELAIADEADPRITVSIDYRVDKKHVWPTHFAQCLSSEFNILDLKQELDDAIKARGGVQQG